MKVILLQDVKSIGKKGQVIEVADGYARNYLMPRKMGIEATASELKKVEDLRVSAQNRHEKQEQEARQLARQLKEYGITLHVKCGESGRLYGTVTAADVSRALKELLNLDIDKKKIEVPEHIKSLGDYEADIWLMPGIASKLKLTIKPLEQD